MSTCDLQLVASSARPCSAIKKSKFEILRSKLEAGGPCPLCRVVPLLAVSPQEAGVGSLIMATPQDLYCGRCHTIF